MKLPIGKISREAITQTFEESIRFHMNVFYETLSDYEPHHLYSHWRSIIRSIDKMINIPLELDQQEEVNMFLGLNFNFFNARNLEDLNRILPLLEKKFDKNIAIRFNQNGLDVFSY